jgi:hypothetical protein
MSIASHMQQHERSKCVALVLVCCFNTLSCATVRPCRREMQIQHANRFAHAATRAIQKRCSRPCVLFQYFVMCNRPCRREMQIQHANRFAYANTSVRMYWHVNRFAHAATRAIQMRCSRPRVLFQYFRVDPKASSPATNNQHDALPLVPVGVVR